MNKIYLNGLIAFKNLILDNANLFDKSAVNETLNELIVVSHELNRMKNANIYILNLHDWDEIKLEELENYKTALDLGSSQLSTILFNSGVQID